MSKTPNRVLVVDDEENIRKVLRQILENADYEVIVAANGSQALELVTEGNIDLVLLDIMMPGKSGMEVLKELKTDYPDIAVIMVTAVGDVNIAIEAIRKGAYDYLNKPFDANVLVISVARGLERRRLILEERNYQLNLERTVAEQTQTLRQKVIELTALNNLFATYLTQTFEAAGKYRQLSNAIIKMAEEVQSLFGQGTDAAASIIKAAEEIHALAKETESYRVEVQTSPPAEQGDSR